MIVAGEQVTAPLDEEFDYVIVGSGAAGATAARVLADTGARLAVVEEGPAVAPREYSDRLFPESRRLFRPMGGLIARGRTFIPILQGSCLGGTTVVNSAIMWRIPEDVWRAWDVEHGLGQALPLEELHGHWDCIERELGVAPTPPQLWGEHNRLLDVARARLGLSGAPTRRAAPGCRGSGRCLTGCPNGAKQSMLASYLPYAERRGATLFSSARVERVLAAGGRAVGVRGRFLPGAGRPAAFQLRARQGVIVAASAIQTPGLLRRSGVRSPHLGRHFQGHPGTPLIGLFPQRVNMWTGATQGYEVDHRRREGRFKIETLSLPPELAFVRFPGVGARWVEALAESPHAVIWAIQLRARSQGSVRERFWGTDVVYDLTDEDLADLRRALRFTAELLFAAGACAVLPGIPGLPERLTDPADAALLEAGPADPAAYSFVLTHLFGTARMSIRPQDGVVGPDFAVHGIRGLYVLDSSLFPTNLGVNPQEPIMGVAMHGARQIAARAPA